MKLNVQPQLSYSTGAHAYWNLSLYPQDVLESESYELRIRRYWDGEKWDHYELYRSDVTMGTEFLLITASEYHDRWLVIVDNAGLDAANEWKDITHDSICVERGIEVDIRSALIRRWEAVCELISPNVTF